MGICTKITLVRGIYRVKGPIVPDAFHSRAVIVVLLMLQFTLITAGSVDCLATITIMARPLKKANERKDVDLRIPVTVQQKETVVAAARADGLETAAWARSILLRAAQRQLRMK